MSPRARRALAATPLVALLAIVLFPWLLRAAAAPLTVPAPSWTGPVERVVILTQGDRRHDLAAELVLARRADGVLVAPWPDPLPVTLGIAPASWRGDVRMLRQRGLDAGRIEVLPPVLTPGDLARRLRQRFADRPEARVVVACHELDCATWRAAARSLAGNGPRVLWWPLRDRRFGSEDWWEHKHGVLAFASAWMRRLHQLLFGPRPGNVRSWDPDAWVEDEARRVSELPEIREDAA